MNKPFEHKLKFSGEGKAGEVKTLSAESPYMFRGLKLIAADTAPQPGTGTRIKMMRANGRNQMPQQDNGGALSLFFSENSLGSGLLLDTIRPGEKFEIDIEFLVDCVFSARVEGQAVK